METKEPQKQFKKDTSSILSLFASNSLPNIHERRIKSDPKQLTNLSFKNTLNESVHEYNPEAKVNETQNEILLAQILTVLKEDHLTFLHLMPISKILIIFL